jgi:hypothetical protein
MERRRFTREFKLEAVRLIRDRGVSYAQVSQDLSVHPTQLRNWVKALAADPQQAFPGQGQMKPECQTASNFDPSYCLICECYPGGAVGADDTAWTDPLRLGGAVGGSGHA